MLKTPSAAACGAPTAAAANASGSERPSLSVVKMATVWLGERDHKSLNFGKWRRRSESFERIDCGVISGPSSCPHERVRTQD